MNLQYLGNFEVHPIPAMRPEMAAPEEAPFVGDLNQVHNRPMRTQVKWRCAQWIPLGVDVECCSPSMVAQMIARMGCLAHITRIERSIPSEDVTPHVVAHPVGPQALHLLVALFVEL